MGEHLFSLAVNKMPKVSHYFVIFMLLFISNISLSYANHADKLTENWRQSVHSTEVSYQGSDMASFVLLKQAKDRKDKIVASLKRWPAQKALLIHNMTNDRGLNSILYLLGVFTLMVACGYFIERVVGFRLNITCNRFIEQKKETWADNLNLLLIRLVFKFLSLGIFFLVSAGFAAYFYPADDPFRILSLHALVLVTKIRICAIFLNLIFAPYKSELRLMSMQCYAAKRLYFSILSFVALYLLITTVWRTLVSFSIEPIMLALVVPLSGFILNIASICFIWFNRKNITQMFTTNNRASSNFTRIFRQAWPTIITFWLLVIWFIWAANEFLGNYPQADRLASAWWLTFSYPILDRMIYVLLTQLKRISWLQSHSFNHRCDVFIRRVIIAIRIILFASVLYMIDSSFGYNTWEMLTSNFSGFLKKSVDVVVVIIFAYALWEVIQSAIERHLPYDLVCAGKDDGLSSLEGDGGGSGASRSETLLPLVRSFLLAFLLVSLTLTVLSILGVEIAPLLAGAGIVGIAVGFGAQKLVQDVISGIFFLLDDAFRRGEYIEAAGLRGTVERISIRSIRLRHHLGAVQTIPFSEIATVRNLSRDWITMKLEFRLDYRTDVEKVRKLIKKVGQKMLKHPEYGQHFLLPLKSQGVIRVEESALIFRMKFTCVPGEQWVIRREAFRLVKDSLTSNGIEFAHRSVHVLMQEKQPSAVQADHKITTPLQETMQQDDAIQPKLAGAAASIVIQSIKKNQKIDPDSE
ncbi:MAG: mechanosensitive ion channel family protein [Osedax symbiont Rs1]|nr:MAG: mechanosensitive ion channel family protein [Osedax symbiont Rs1]